MRWLLDRLKGAINSWVERAILAALGIGAIAAWRKRHEDLTVDVTLPVWVAIVLAALLLLAVVAASKRWGGRRVKALEAEVELSAYYSRHLYDTLESLQKVLAGTIPGVNVGTFIEQGILDPARNFLMQIPGEEVRLSILVPNNGEWRMAYAAGYRLESRQRFSLPIIGSFSRYAYESGQMQWSGDLETDQRFTPHPQAGRVYKSIISVPIRTGDDVVAVFNVDSNLEDAFPSSDFVYVNLLGAIISVVWALGGYDPHAPPPAQLEGGQEEEENEGNNDVDRDVH